MSPEKDAVVTIQEIPQQHSPSSADQGYFSWIQDEEAKKTSLSKAKAIPWLGIAALAGSGIVALLSLAILLAVDGHETWQPVGIYKVMQPASWLSAMISANSILLHVALTQGVTVAWWFRATRSQTTVADLHNTWATGTSALSAVTSLRRLDYVSLATLFVAVIPLNGFILQGALTTPVSTLTRDQTIQIPMVQQLQKGYSSTMTNNDTAVTYFSQTYWPVVFQQVQNAANSLYSQYAYFGDLNVGDLNDNYYLSEFYDNDTVSSWQTKVPGAGFEYNCIASQVPFDITPQNSTTPVTATVFDTSFSWNETDPNVMYLDVWWKDTSDCSGFYEVRNCTLTAATVEYPVQVQLNVPHPYPGPYYSLIQPTTYRDDRVLRKLPVYDDESVGNTTYGGMYMSFSEWFDSSIVLSNYTTDFDGSVDAQGQFAQGLNLMQQSIDHDFLCNASFEWGIMNVGFFQAFNRPTAQENVTSGWRYYYSTVDVADLILEQVRQSAFLAAVYSGSQWWSDNYVPPAQMDYDNESWWVPGGDDRSNYVQTVPAVRHRTVPIYHANLALWAASVALTYVIILVILPTFWGFWVLGRKPTMSPVDVARAFHAPIVLSRQEHAQLPVDELLEEVGGTAVRTGVTPNTTTTSNTMMAEVVRQNDVTRHDDGDARMR